MLEFNFYKILNIEATAFYVILYNEFFSTEEFKTSQVCRKVYHSTKEKSAKSFII